MASFQKRRIQSSSIQGTKPSPLNAQVITSSGTPSMDFFIVDQSPETLLAEIPGPIAELKPDQEDIPMEKPGDMKIAWRYGDLPAVQTSIGVNRFDLTKKMDANLLNSCNLTYWNGSAEHGIGNGSQINPQYVSLLKNIQEVLSSKDGKVYKATNLHRIALSELGSPLFGEEGVRWKPDTNVNSLLIFLHSLKSLLRLSSAVAFVTLPSELLQNKGLVKRCEGIADFVLRLESFVGSEKETNPVFKDFHGLFHIVKLPVLNSLTHFIPDTLDLAFKLRRKKFSIERLHLPPELSDTAARPQEDPVPNLKASAGCMPTGGHINLDF
ncbi:unnamed protein product [Darwinula stevensoni]|uniref:Elongator complex protein 4 n=1 Tax=Darwinula stevensoni TaxID=69355 RepID=A0A7R8WZX1_9CRUS|nr:unnamed protein product [Darwinula stevensoni]CAG0880483.1 unnamed protein product [Darwinula stevensoni]